MKIDPYKTEEHYLSWKENIRQTGIKYLSKSNSDLLLTYLEDMEIGVNVGHGSKKGSRSYIRLKSLRDKVTFVMKSVSDLYKIDPITNLSEDKIHGFFSAMRKGDIKRKDGQNYKAVADYVKIFKAFWNWWVKINRKKGVAIVDLCSDLDTQNEKPDWVYLTEDQVKKLANGAKYEYRVLVMFLFDSGIRSPTELMNVKVSDLYNDCKELNIREETSKTFGRRIKLMICSELLKDYIKVKELTSDDYIFKITPSSVNQYLHSLSKKLFGDVKSPAGTKYSELTMYDFRHISCCYWLPRYKSESALKYRFGWKKSDKIHYYSELLGMKDTINQDDMLVDLTKTEIEQQLQRTQKENELLQEKMKTMELQIARIMEVTNQIETVKGGL
jgi:hypothetical protein